MTEQERIGNQIAATFMFAGAICRKWRTFLCYRTSDGIHIALQIAQSLPPDLSHSVAKGVPSPARKSRSASTRRASCVRFVSPAFPLLRYLIVAKQGVRLQKLPLPRSAAALATRASRGLVLYGFRKSPLLTANSIGGPKHWNGGVHYVWPFKLGSRKAHIIAFAISADIPLGRNKEVKK